jgi:hypothetical protein
MTIRESEAVILREVVRRLLDGESSRSIVMDLRRRVVKTSTGKDWHGHTIQRIISSPRICGIRTHLGTHCKAQWPAIISSEDWQRVQVVWRARARHGTTAPRRYRCARDEAYYHRSRLQARPQTAGEEDCHPSGQDTAAVHDNEQTFRFDTSLMRIIWEV